MKLTVLVIILTLSSFNIDCNEKFEIIKASSQEWKGGRQETGFGTYYELTIVPKVNSGKLRFDKLWIGEKYFQISCYQKGKRVKNDTFGSGDTITIHVNNETVPESMLPVEKDKFKNENPKPPKKYKGEALLSYLYNGKRKYKIIETFIIIEAVYYP